MSYDAYTKFLANFDGLNGATAFTAETGQVLAFHGDAHLDTSVKKFGTASLACTEAGGGYCTVSDANFAMGTDDFTIDMQVQIPAWAMPGDPVNGLLDIDTGGAVSGRLAIPVIGDGSIEIDNGLGTLLATAPAVVPLNTMFHFAVVRQSGVMKLFINGVEKASGAVATDFTCTDMFIGSMYSTFRMTGYLDELRISKGIARWFSNFTPPTYAYGSRRTTAPMIISFNE